MTIAVKPPRGRLELVEVTLLDEMSRPIARGHLPIDLDEGAPRLIEWRFDTYQRIAGVLHYQRVRPYRASDEGFRAIGGGR